MNKKQKRLLKEMVAKILITILTMATPIILSYIADFLATVISMEMIMKCVYTMGIIGFITLLKM